jgi:hypothetical protein
MHFFNFQALLNHRANACSCSFFKRTGVLSFFYPRTKDKISYKNLIQNPVTIVVKILGLNAAKRYRGSMSIFCDLRKFSAFFLKTNVMIQIWQKLTVFWTKNRHFFARFLGENI